jgi:hypothetical protein
MYLTFANHWTTAENTRSQNLGLLEAKTWPLASLIFVGWVLEHRLLIFVLVLMGFLLNQRDTVAGQDRNVIQCTQTCLPNNYFLR